MKSLILVSLAIIGCGILEKTPMNPPVNPISAELQTQIERISPLLHKCDGMPAKPTPNEITPRPFCNVGNSFLYAGHLLSVVNDTEMVQGIKDSFTIEGKPYRSPEHRRANDSVNEFSRDMLQGFLMSLIRTRDIDQLKLFWNYSKSHDYIMCNGKEEEGINRCYLTPTILYFVGEIFEYLGEQRPAETKIAESIALAAALYDVQTVPVNFRLMLVANQVYLKMLTNKMSQPWVRITEYLKKRSPNNLWYRYLDNAAHKGNIAEYENISNQLIKYMQVFPAGDQGSWIWSQGDSIDSMGYDLLFLAHRLKPELK